MIFKRQREIRIVCIGRVLKAQRRVMLCASTPVPGSLASDTPPPRRRRKPVVRVVVFMFLHSDSQWWWWWWWWEMKQPRVKAGSHVVCEKTFLTRHDIRAITRHLELSRVGGRWCFDHHPRVRARARATFFFISLFLLKELRWYRNNATPCRYRYDVNSLPEAWIPSKTASSAPRTACNSCARSPVRQIRRKASKQRGW